jgi:hypothetical protein
MKIDYFVKDSDLPSTIETAGDGQSFPWIEPGVVYDFDGASGEYGPTEFTPAQARAKAAALIRAADEAEDAMVPDEFDESHCGGECRNVVGLCDHYETWYRASMRKAWRGVRGGLEGVMTTLEGNR